MVSKDTHLGFGASTDKISLVIVKICTGIFPFEIGTDTKNIVYVANSHSFGSCKNLEKELNVEKKHKLLSNFPTGAVIKRNTACKNITPAGTVVFCLGGRGEWGRGEISQQTEKGMENKRVRGGLRSKTTPLQKKTLLQTASNRS